MNFETIEITVMLNEYDEDNHYYLASFDGKEVQVDPYVGAVWPDEKKELGEFKFEGFWGTLGVFLVEKEI